MVVDCHMHAWKFPDHFRMDVFRHALRPHQRTWEIERLKKIWDNPIERYIAEMEGVIDKAIIIASAFGEIVGIEIPNDYVAELVKKYPDKFAGVCSVNPNREGAVKELERCVKELGMVGLKLSPPEQGFYADDENIAFPIYDKAQELNIPIIFHVGYIEFSKARLIHANVLLLDEVAINFPDLKIVICHMGYYNYQDAVALMAKHENVYSDISWLVGLAGLDRSAVPWNLPVVEYPYFHLLFPLLYHFTQTRGVSDKLLFGTDWPGSKPKRAVEVTEGINLVLKEHNLPHIPRVAIHNILHRNWRQVFKF